MAKGIAVEVIGQHILFVRGKRVMADKDLARLYGVETKNLNKAVKRNLKRFPDDFMFRLSVRETENLRFQFGTSSWGGRRYLPYVFTQEGVAMLSSVLNSERAIMVNVQIMRAFVKFREVLLSHKDLAAKIAALERKYSGHDRKIHLIFAAIKGLVSPSKPEVRVIKGFAD